MLARLLQNELEAHRAAASTPAAKIPVLSWCCICGVPVALEVEPDYRFALHEFIMLDKQHRAHKQHIEEGGWGIHWRLDEVLEAVFPDQHVMPRFHRPPWYTHNEASEFVVRIMTEADKRQFARQAIDAERRMMDRWINGKHRTRKELRAELDEMGISTTVWDTDELKQSFEVLYFASPFVVVIDRRTGRQGSMMFQNEPRLFFGFDPERLV